MTALDAAARPHLDRLLAELAAAGASPRTLGAVLAVPRNRFVTRFYARPAGAGPYDARVREWTLDPDEPDDDVLAVVYDRHQALALRSSSRGRTTSTVSAPALQASMLDRLDVQPGHRVLEIGTGSGFFAGLIAHLTGDPSLVTSVDVDETLIDDAPQSLAAAGQAGVEVRAADGDAGAADRAPFDRIVASVGCNDVSPRWLEQLAPGGFALIPLHHGGVHPVLRIEPAAGGGATAAAAGRSAFVFILGEQAEDVWWVAPGRLGPTEGVTYEPLPPDLEGPSQAGDGWSATFHLSLVDRRTAHTLALSDGAGSSAAALPAQDRVGHAGREGPALRDALLAHLRQWIALGRPKESDYSIEFVPVSQPAPEGAATGPWVIGRRSFHEVVTLRPPT